MAVGTVVVRGPVYLRPRIAEFQRLKHVINHEKVFKTRLVRANDCYNHLVRRHNKDIFSIFFNMNV